jgi:hypothetical protein
LSISVTASLTDSISHLKDLVAQSSSTAPPADAQRLLLKGKALTDSKLLKEYDVTDGATIHLIIKSTPVISEGHTGSPSLSPSTSFTPGHHRTASDPALFAANDRAKASSPTQTPILTITTSMPGSDGLEHPSKPTPLTLMDTMGPPKGPQPQISSAAFHGTISSPKFWEEMRDFLVGQFAYEDDADAAWESFLVAMKGRLSAGEAAKIRDVVGINGESAADLMSYE